MVSYVVIIQSKGSSIACSSSILSHESREIDGKAKGVIQAPHVRATHDLGRRGLEVLFKELLATIKRFRE